MSRPARAVVVAFGLATAIGTVLLMLPMAHAAGEQTGFVVALFTATGAICGALVLVDTGTHWSTFGEVVILVLIQLGGLGIMTLASLLGVLVAQKMGLRMQLVAQAETGALGLGDSKRVAVGVVVMSLAIEAVTAMFLFVRFLVIGDESVGRSLYSAVFHSISAYCNAGFALYPDNMIGFASDPWIILPLTVALVLGGLGYPVLFEVGRSIKRRVRGRKRVRWTLHTKITLITYFGLVVVGMVLITAIEWRNPRTFGHLGAPDSLMAGLFHSISPRTGGFNSVDIGSMYPSSLLVTDLLMFIGGGSASTAGGIKVTTFALLAFVVMAEIRGEPTVHVMGRRLAATVQRQAISVALVSIGAVMVSTLVLLQMTQLDLDQVLFECISAFGTVGLSTGITSELPDAALIVLVLLMFVGRLGPITFASALALRERRRRYELPEERPIVG